MFNREVKTKLPRFTTASRGQHHKEARQQNWEAKQLMKKQYDKKHRTRLVEIKPGDWAYTRRTATSSTKGPWDPIPYQITFVYENQVTGKRQIEEKTRYRNDWKLLVARPAHLQAFQPKARQVSAPTPTHMPVTGWSDNNDWNDDDEQPKRPTTRATRVAQWAQQQQQTQQPAPHKKTPTKTTPTNSAGCSTT